MVEQPDACKSHCHTIAVTTCDDVIVKDGTARLGNILYAAFTGPLNIIAKWKESV